MLVSSKGITYRCPFPILMLVMLFIVVSQLRNGQKQEEQENSGPALFE